MLHYTVHVTSLCSLENQSKCLAERLLVLQTCSHHALVEGGKDKTERCS